MPAFRILLVTWLLAGFGAVVGSILGGGLGRAGLFAGAAVGGLLGVSAAVLVLRKVGWLPVADRRGAYWGGTCGFAIAIPFAVLNLDTPITPVVSCALAGIGALLGIGVARGMRQGGNPPTE
jgi:hypothetical protein